MCHEIFDLHFFHDSNPSEPLIYRLKYFPIRFRFHRDIRSQSCLPGVQHTVVCIPPRSQSLRYRGDDLLGVQHTAEMYDQNFFKKSPGGDPHRGVSNSVNWNIFLSLFSILRYFALFHAIAPSQFNFIISLSAKNATARKKRECPPQSS